MSDENKLTTPVTPETPVASNPQVTPPTPQVTPTTTPQPNTSSMEAQLKALSETNIKLSQQLEEYNKKLVLKEQPKKEVDFVELFKK